MNETDNPTLRDPAHFTLNRSIQAAPVRTNFEMHCFCAVVARGKMEIKAEVLPRNGQLFPARHHEPVRSRANPMRRIAEESEDKS
jgi:hypothetical protein